MRGHLERVCAASMPPLAASVTSAPSVGSATHRPAAGALDEPRVAGKQATLQQQRDAGIPRRSTQAPFGRVADPTYLDGPVPRVEPANGHFALGERTGLVGTDHAGATQCLDGGHSADQGIALRHLMHRYRQRPGDDGRERFGDRRHRQRDGEHDHAECGLESESARPQVARKADADHQHADAERDDAQPLAQFLGAALERRLLGLDRRHFLGDLPELRLHAGGGDHSHAPSVRRDRAGEHHVPAVTDRRIAAEQNQLLADRDRLPGERRLVALQGMNLHQAAVGGNLVARFEQQDVAGNQFFGGHLLLLSTPQDRYRRRQHALEGFQCLLGAILLHESQHRAENDDDENDAGIHVLADQCRQNRGNDQDDDQDVLELREENFPGRGLLFLGQLVRAVLQKAILDLLGRKTLLRLGIKRFQNGGHFHRMPGVQFHAVLRIPAHRR